MGHLLLTVIALFVIFVVWLGVMTVSSMVRDMRSHVTENEINIEKHNKKIREIKANQMNILNDTNDRSFKTGKKK